MATNAVCLFPGMLKLFMKEWEGKTMRMVGIGLTVLAIIMQLTSMIIWPVVNRFTPNVCQISTQVWSRAENDIDVVWSLPVGLFLTSFGWWECYVQEQGTWSK